MCTDLFLVLSKEISFCRYLSCDSHAIDVIMSFEPTLALPLSSSIHSLSDSGAYCAVISCFEQANVSCSGCNVMLCSECSTSHASCDKMSGDILTTCHSNVSSVDNEKSSISIRSNNSDSSTIMKKGLSSAQQKKEATAKRNMLKAALSGVISK